VKKKNQRLMNAFIAGFNAARGMNGDDTDTEATLKQAWKLFNAERKGKVAPEKESA
jgi:hypothetical protein